MCSSRGKKTSWFPKPYSRICSAHFIDNKKSDNPSHPAYIPTIFPDVYKKNDGKTNDLERFRRKEKRAHSVAKEKARKKSRETFVDEFEVETFINELESEPERAEEISPKTSDFGCQVK